MYVYGSRVYNSVYMVFMLAWFESPALEQVSVEVVDETMCNAGSRVTAGSCYCSYRLSSD